MIDKVFITGGTGFIGKRLVRALENNNTSITLLSKVHQQGFETVVCDLKSDQVPCNSLSGIDTVFHLAGLTHCNRNDLKVEHLYRKINVESTVQLANLAIKSGVKRFIFVSSVKAGGSAIAGRCITEKNQGEPEGMYGRTKREAEIKLLQIAQKSNMHVSIVTPSLVYGPNVKGNLSLMQLGILKGWFPPLPETGNSKSMIHVDDLVRSLILVASDNRANREIFNAADSKVYSSREIYETMCFILGKSVPNWYVPKLFFNIAAALSPSIRYKINKLFGEDCYSSDKLKSLGFTFQRSLREMNETSF